MRKAIIVLTVMMAVVALCGSTAFAGGFRIPESGARAMGFANAFVGLADDPSAVQFNPAGITQLEGNRILLGGTSISTENTYTSTGGTSTDANDMSFLPPYFYYTNHLGTGPWWLGLGLNAPFGLGTDWEVASFQYIVTKTNLEMLKVNPTVAYRVRDNLSFALGVDYYDVMEATFENEAMLAGPTPAYQKLTGDGTALGFDLGARYAPQANLAFGFAYRSAVTSEIEGNLDITIDATGNSAPTFPVNAKVDLNLPSTLALGVSYGIGDAWRVNFDLDWTGWSAYDELNIKNASTGATIRNIPKDYKDTTAYRLGVEYKLDERWALRGGLLIDSMPVPEETYDPRLPDGDRTGYVVGAGYGQGPWSVNLAYMLLNLDQVDIDNAITDAFTIGQTVDGSYEGSITLIGFDVGYAF